MVIIYKSSKLLCTGDEYMVCTDHLPLNVGRVVIPSYFVAPYTTFDLISSVAKVGFEVEIRRVVVVG